MSLDLDKVENTIKELKTKKESERETYWIINSFTN